MVTFDKNDDARSFSPFIEQKCWLADWLFYISLDNAQFACLKRKKKWSVVSDTPSICLSPVTWSVYIAYRKCLFSADRRRPIVDGVIECCHLWVNLDAASDRHDVCHPAYIQCHYYVAVLLFPVIPANTCTLLLQPLYKYRSNPIMLCMGNVFTK